MRAPIVSAAGMRIGHGSVVRLNAGHVSLASSHFSDATTLTGTLIPSPEDGVLVVDGREIPVSEAPVIRSFAGANVAGLTLSELDLSRCLFVGARNLHLAKLGRNLTFSSSPSGLRAGRKPPFLWRWTTRRVLYEESLLRAGTARGSGWHAAAQEIPLPHTIRLHAPRHYLLQALKAQRDRYEQRYAVMIKDEALETATESASTLHEIDETEAAYVLLETAVALSTSAESDAANPDEERLRNEIEVARRQKEDDILAGDFGAALGARDRERELLRELSLAQLERFRLTHSAERLTIGEVEVRAAAAALTGELSSDPRETAPVDSEDGHGRTARDLAAVYRALRRAKEEERDAPGAADFYYGEMEMRRGDADRNTVDRFVLTAYWASSGYGLRASRALSWLLVLVFVVAVLLRELGTHRGTSLARTLVYAGQSAVPGLSPLSLSLNYLGQTMRVVMHVAGPLLLGLAIFSLRGRIQR